ncbi:MAG: hypothetical protein AUK47_16530 [Deltaproteobacteria bacterium CG2_30_63_29]|nr:MAG: hypothetical protein AUK47_16530 [Deltaproteobacteria bacterium CG2_30_63_29]PIV98267.1 MAG: hypothetical protein COW42_15700 [Deltaproteobacteria bacterium CG17_big_fil_post_rev_8_21_14_2_50_63_7]PJB34741.1 MAG: hypothetical protein CO108_27655 [Deltaproteobacteria bacterium CG_4_9_14_3_um_filter_63_12]
MEPALGNEPRKSKQMKAKSNTKSKVILILAGLVGLLVAWFLFKKTIMSVLTTVAVGAIVIALLYVAIRVWWWRRTRKR